MQPFFNPNVENWFQLQTLSAKSYSYGFCSDKISSEKGYKIGKNPDGSGGILGAIYVCPNCKGPTFFTPAKEQIPSASVGQSVSHVPDELDKLYDEARRCTTNNCYTAAVLVCRKILMNIAVQVGAKEGESFIAYINFLSDKGYIPPNGKHWVDHIQKKGNEANHEIKLMDNKDATELLVFIEMLLKFIYEFPNMIPPESV